MYFGPCRNCLLLYLISIQFPPAGGFPHTGEAVSDAEDGPLGGNVAEMTD